MRFLRIVSLALVVACALIVLALGSQVGRYQIAVCNGDRSDAPVYVLDTVSGRLYLRWASGQVLDLGTIDAPISKMEAQLSPLSPAQY